MEQEFKDAMMRSGVSPAHGLILDGKLRRYRVEGDRKGRKNGWYRYVQVSPEYAWAVFGCNKRGQSEKWSSKATKNINNFEIKERKRIENRIRETEEELQNKTAVKCNEVWGRLKWATKHPYSDLKGIGLYGIKEMHRVLVVPAYYENYLVSFQYITADGFKGFIKDGRSKDCYCLIGDETETLYICEGYATGASVHEAMGQQVCLAFYASNIPGVAKQMRAKWPDRKIVIAADNDQFTKGNPGISYAQEAAVESKCLVKYPLFDPLDPAKNTDWNDWHVKFGLKSVADEIFGTKKNVPVVKEELKWTHALLEKNHVEQGGYKDFDPKSKENAYIFMENHPLFKNMLVYNIFTDSIFLMRCPPWERQERFFPREQRESDPAMYVKEFEKIGIKTSKDVVIDYMMKIAYDNVINPAKDYFEKLKWDGTPRINNWLTYYLGAEKQDKKYLEAVGSKWLMGAVSRIYNPGCKFDNVLILEGKQDIKKSMAFEVLATFNEEIYFLEFSGDVSSKDSLTEMHGNLIVELSELASLAKADFNYMKAFITRKIDKYRPAYGRNQIKRPRYFVFAATTNNDGAEGYLVDPTGGRRFWPVECSHVDIDGLKMNKDQLWAEAVYRYDVLKERTWLEDDEKEWASIEQVRRKEEDSWTEPVNDFLLTQGMETSVFKIARGLNLTAEQTNTKNAKRIVRILRDLGWEPSKNRPRTDSGRITIWRRKV